jgi:hypothetical protein
MPEDIFDTVCGCTVNLASTRIFTQYQGIALPVKRDRVKAKKILPRMKSLRSSKLLAIRSQLRRCSASA